MRTIIVMFAFLLCTLAMQAQDEVTVAGGTETSASGSVSYSVGQVFYSSVESSAGKVNEGIQIPYEILVITSIEGFEAIKLEVSAYPNPVSDYLILQIGSYELTDLKYQLYNSDGKLLEEFIIESDNTHINLEVYTTGIYYLKVDQKGTQVKTFKVVKN